MRTQQRRNQSKRREWVKKEREGGLGRGEKVGKEKNLEV
jgi:hypothetical protein